MKMPQKNRLNLNPHLIYPFFFCGFLKSSLEVATSQTHTTQLCIDKDC